MVGTDLICQPTLRIKRQPPQRLFLNLPFCMSYAAILQVLFNIAIRDSASISRNNHGLLLRTSRTSCLAGCASFARVDPSRLRTVVVSCWYSFLNWGLLSRIVGSQGGIIAVIAMFGWCGCWCGGWNRHLDSAHRLDFLYSYFSVSIELQFTEVDRFCLIYFTSISHSHRNHTYIQCHPKPTARKST